MNPVASLTFSLLAFQYLISVLATESSADHHIPSSRRFLKSRTASSDLSAPLGRTSFVDQRTPRKSLCGEFNGLQGSADDAKRGENMNGITKCNVDRGSISRVIKPSPSTPRYGSTAPKGNTLKRFQSRRSLIQHRHGLPTSGQATDPDTNTEKSTVSENIGLGASEHSAAEDAQVRQTRGKRDLAVRTTDRKLREKRPTNRNSFANLNPWSRHLFHLYGLRQKSNGLERRRSDDASPARKKRVWEDIDMPAWGKRLAVDDNRGERKASNTIEILAKPQETSRLESLHYDDSYRSQPEWLTKENLGWEKRNWEDIDMHAWGKRDRSLDNIISADIAAN